MANGLLSNILGFNPATYQQEQLALLTNPIRQAKDPYERVGATLGSLIGGAFMAEDPQLKRAADIQSVLGGVQFDPANPAESYNSIARELANKGYAAEALTAAQEAMKFRSTKTESKVVPPGATLTDSQGNVLFTNDAGPAMAEIKTVDLGDRIEYYQKGQTKPFKTERKGEAPTTQFRRELEQVKEEDKKDKQTAAAQGAIANGTRVLSTVNEAKGLVGTFTTGGIGGVAALLPQTDARKLANKIKTIKANLGFDRLQQMRDASPTGGALGQVAVQEIEFLQSTVATLDQLESADDILEALGKIEQSYTTWLNAVRNRAPAAQQGAAPAQAQPTGLPQGVTVRKVK
jgi:hypothetical protein